MLLRVISVVYNYIFLPLPTTTELRLQSMSINHLHSGRGTRKRMTGTTTHSLQQITTKLAQISNVETGKTRIATQESHSTCEPAEQCNGEDDDEGGGTASARRDRTIKNKDLPSCDGDCRNRTTLWSRREKPGEKRRDEKHVTVVHKA